MPGMPTIDEVVDEIIDAWAGPGAVTDGFLFESALAGDDLIEVAFRWRLDPQRYRIDVAYPGWILEALGDRFDASSAVAELALWLMEELDTGLLGRAERRPVDGAVLLVDRPREHDGWFVGAVPLELRAEDPRALEHLVLAACRTAVEAGAEVLVADRELRSLIDFGFIDDGHRLVARHDEIRPPG